MKIINSFENKTLDGATLFCAEMSDGSTWFNIAAVSLTINSSDDDLENGGMMLADIYKNRVFEMRDNAMTLSQFVDHINSFINY